MSHPAPEMGPGVEGWVGGWDFPIGDSAGWVLTDFLSLPFGGRYPCWGRVMARLTNRANDSRKISREGGRMVRARITKSWLPGQE